MNQTNFQNLLNPSWTAGNRMKTNKTGYRKNMVAFVGSAFVAVVLSAALLLAGCSGTVKVGNAVPDAPIDLVVSPGDMMGDGKASTATLAWSAGGTGFINGDGTEGVITKYTVYYSTSDLADLSLSEVKSEVEKKNVFMEDAPMEKGAPHGLRIFSLDINKELFFVVTASNAEGESLPSVSVRIITDNLLQGNHPPDLVPDVKVAPGDATLTVTWTAPGNTGSVDDGGTEGTITHYTVYYSPEKISNLWGANVKSVTIDDPALKTYTVTGLENGNDYYFVVTASNAFAEGRGLISIDTTGGVVGTPGS